MDVDVLVNGSHRAVMVDVGVSIYLVLGVVTERDLLAAAGRDLVAGGGGDLGAVEGRWSDCCRRARSNRR